MIANGQVQMSTTVPARVGVDEADHGNGSEITITVTGSGTAFLGGTNGVTAASGMPVSAGAAPFRIPLQLGDQIWALASAATVFVNFLQTGV